MRSPSRAHRRGLKVACQHGRPAKDCTSFVSAGRRWPRSTRWISTMKHCGCWSRRSSRSASRNPPTCRARSVRSEGDRAEGSRLPPGGSRVPQGAQGRRAIAFRERGGRRARHRTEKKQAEQFALLRQVVGRDGRPRRSRWRSASRGTLQLRLGVLPGSERSRKAVLRPDRRVRRSAVADVTDLHRIASS